MSGLLVSLQGAVAQGVLWGIMVLGVYITFRLMNIADMTNKSKGEYAYTMIDIDSDVTDSVIEDLTKVKDVLRVRVIR